MIKARAWPAKAMYFLIAAALAISLIIVAAPPHEASAANGDVDAEWTQVDTPTYEGFVLAPQSIIIDYALAEGGDVAYAIIDGKYEDPDDDWSNEGYRLLKSDNGAATWDDITEALWDEAEDELFDADGFDYINELISVATDWEDPDFVAVALEWCDEDLGVPDELYIHVFISDDGGDTFKDAGEVKDNGKYFFEPDDVADLAISYEDDGEHEIAIGGLAYDDTEHVCGLFRCTVDGDSPEAWKDATDWAGNYPGWDDNGGLPFPSYLVTDIIFSFNWELDRTILVVTAANQTAIVDGYAVGDVYLQSGVWGPTSQAWNEDAAFAPAVPVIEDEGIPFWLMPFDGRSIAGVTIPIDYDGSNADKRYLWVWVNYYDGEDSIGMIYRVRDDAPDDVDTQISKTPWLTNVSYMGYKAEGKAIAGVLAKSEERPLDETDLIKDCCEVVDVYRNGPDTIENMEICCNEWDKACKPPTGRFAMAVSYVSDEKAYAVALGGDDRFDYDESAWSVSVVDDGDTWNQLSLVDTWIDYLSDVAVSPDCNKTMIVSVHDDGDCACDSVWLHAENLPEAPEYSGYWIRTWSGEFQGSARDGKEWGLLRLAPEETTGDTVYLVDYGTDNVYYNSMETWACWESGTATVDDIVDLAVKDEATIFALDYYGDVAMSDNHGAALTWSEPVDSQVGFGHTIAVWGDYILVGGQDGDVSYTDNFDPDAEDADEDVFTELDETTPIEGYVTVAFDSYFDQNDAFYAAVDGDSWPTSGGIYLWILGESEDWEDIDACPDYAYTGLVLDNADGNPMTSPETGGVLYASFIGQDGPCGISGVARTLTPIVEICCDVGETEWDYLVESDPEDRFYACMDDFVDFDAWPDALKICGCLTPDSNTHLFAIDNGWEYDMIDHEDGAVWTFEDCYAKKGIELTGPEDGGVIPADPCECDNVPFSLTWDRLCDACCYEFEFALDEDFTQIVTVEQDYWETLLDRFLEECCGKNGEEPMGEGECCVDCCAGYCPEAPLTPTWQVPSDGTFICEFTYYWRARAVQAETGQCIRSWWSEPMSFTIAPSRDSAKLDLISPVPGALDQPIKNVGFSWDLAAEADSFDWELKKAGVEVDSATGLTDTYYEYAGPLDYGTTYNWQVTAYKNGSAITMSAVGTFTTGAHGPFCCADCGLCFETQDELTDHIATHNVPPPTPTWVWVVIGLGAALVIVVIVLIFRTRRV